MEHFLDLVIKTILIYVIVVVSLRIMGKRQIAQLQPSELVVTLMISEIATAPVQDGEKSMLDIIIPIATLVIFEILLSVLDLKSTKFRNLVQGQSIIIIHNGKVNMKELKKLRYSMEDLWEELRKKDIFDIADVQYAIAETDGSLSVLPMPEKRHLTAEDLGKKVHGEAHPAAVKEEGIKRDKNK